MRVKKNNKFLHDVITYRHHKHMHFFHLSEFTSLYMGPVAYPDRALELMFKLHDTDKNGYISQWEYLRVSLSIVPLHLQSQIYLSEIL